MFSSFPPPFLLSRTALRFRVRMAKLSKNDASAHTPSFLVRQAKETVFDLGRRKGKLGARAKEIDPQKRYQC